MSSLEQIKKLNIIKIAERLGLELNSNNKVCCVFHEERTPSMSFFGKENANMFKCFNTKIHRKN